MAEKEFMVTLEWGKPKPRKVHIFAGTTSLKGRPVDRLTVHRPLTKEEYNACFPLLCMDKRPNSEPRLWRMKDGPWRPNSEFAESMNDG